MSAEPRSPGWFQEHEPRLVTKADVRREVHGTSAAGRFNSWLAVNITRGVGTMWVAYLFAGLALISLPAAIASHETIIIVAWIAQTFLQLVLLPIIIVGQNVISTAQDKRAEADHDTLLAINEMNKQQLKLLEGQAQILQMLEKGAAKA
jgi:hypothetical protein